MGQRISLRIWAILGIGITTIAGLVLLLVLLERGTSESVLTITPTIPTPPGDQVVASIVFNQDVHSITRPSWQEAVLLDQVLSGMAGQPAPAPNETLDQLINEELVLHAIPPEQTPTAEQIEAQITALEQTWGVDDTALVAALEEVGLIRTALERAMGRSLTVQAGLEALQSQGYDTTDWLEKQRASVEIVLLDLDEEFENVAVPYIPIAQSPLATVATSPIPTPVPATATPPPTPNLAVPDVAPDFTLERAGGGTLKLAEQLAQGPVVLVFFQRGG